MVSPDLRTVGQHKGVYQSSNAVWNYQPSVYPEPYPHVQLTFDFPNLPCGNRAFD